jgi:hypothetical protein
VASSNTIASGLVSSTLLEKINKLFACNAEEHVDLSQLVVVGDQSSGKSSVLEAPLACPSLATVDYVLGSQRKSPSTDQLKQRYLYPSFRLKAALKIDRRGSEHAAQIPSRLSTQNRPAVSWNK